MKDRLRELLVLRHRTIESLIVDQVLLPHTLTCQNLHFLGSY